MWIRACATLLSAGILMAQENPEPEQARKQKARELLEKVEITLGSVDPEVHVIALTQIAGAWKGLDDGRASRYLEQAFAAAAALPQDDRAAGARMEGEIVKSAVTINLPQACELLRGMPGGAAGEARVAAAEAVVDALVDKKEFDKAMEVLALTPADADYAFAAAQRLFEELPKDDGRRLLVFTNAAAAYRRRPADAFHTFLAKHWKDVPKQTAQAALGSVVNTIRDREEEPGAGESLETPKGTVKLAGRKSMQLFDLLGVIRALDPVRYKLLEEQYPDLKAAAQRFPDGRQSVESGTFQTVAKQNGWHSGYQDSVDFEALPPISLFAESDQSGLQDAMRAFHAANRKAGEALAAFGKDHNRGIALADDVAVLSIRAQLLLKFATEVKKQDAAGARALLAKADAITGDIPYLGDRIAPASSAAELEHELNDDKAAWESLQRALEGLIAVYRSDTDAKKPNRAPREFWPSTFSCRGLMWMAVKLFGTRSEELLAPLPSPDLVLMAQIEMARSLLKVSAFDSEHGTMSWQVLHSDSN